MSPSTRCWDQSRAGLPPATQPQPMGSWSPMVGTHETQQGDAASTSRTPLGSLGCALTSAACWGSNTEWVAPLRCCAGRTVCQGHITHGDPEHPAMGGVKGCTTGWRAEIQDQPQSQGSLPLELFVLGEMVPHPTRASESCCPKHGHKVSLVGLKVSSWGTKGAHGAQNPAQPGGFLPPCGVIQKHKHFP